MSESGDSGPGRREIAHRLFAAEFDDADFSYSESDEERAPNYVVTPSGARVNRMFLVGVLTETEWVNDDMLRARIVDPTGPFVSYAGQYQPEALAFLESVEPPAFLAVTGKARTFEPEDGDRVFTSVRPESISEVDADTRDRWAVEAARRTIERVETMAAAMETGLAGEELVAALEADGVDPTLASGIALALDHYGTTPDYLDALRDLAEDALAMVAGEADEVGKLDVAPDEGSGSAAALAGREIAAEGSSESASGAEFESVSEGTSAGVEESESEPASEEPEPEPAATDEPEPASTTEPTADTATEPESDSEPEPEPATEESDPATEEPEPESEPEPEPTAETSAEPDDELGDFEADDDLGDFDPEEDDALTDEEREEVEEEFGTGFSTGNEVEPEPELEPDDEPAAEPDEDEGEATEPVSEEPEPEPETEPEPEPEPEPESEEPAADVPLDEAVMDAMGELDDGDGADHDELVATVSERTGAAPEEVEAAIEDALMSGQCYEPDDGVLKPI